MSTGHPFPIGRGGPEKTFALAVSSPTAIPSASGGAFSQPVPAFAEADLLRGELPRTIVAVREAPSFRTNLVLVAGARPVEVRFALCRKAGKALRARHRLPTELPEEPVPAAFGIWGRPGGAAGEGALESCTPTRRRAGRE